MSDIAAEYSIISAFLKQKGIFPRKVVDIGCGHAFADLLFYREFQPDLHLVDVEITRETHHDYHESGAGYASLNAAKCFLEKNGVPAGRIELTNPTERMLKDASVDLIVSMISCGFHYPLLTYLPFVKEALAANGCFIFDLRKESGQEIALKSFSHVELICEQPKYKRLAAFV